MARGKLKVVQKPTAITTRKPRTVPLNNLFDCQRFLAGLVNEMRRYEVDSNEAAKQAYVVSLLIKTYELTDIEDKISQLEERLTNSN